ncbi:MAG: alkaline phosphatase D family protein [Chitinophagaceae bacterium]|nr:alkaline phosphatase D family protein [Chitinophagaceae bacterium]
MKRIAVILGLMALWIQGIAQVAAGPMLGPVTLRTASVWIALEQPAASVLVRYWPEGGNKAKAITAMPTTSQPANQPAGLPVVIRHITLGGLEPGTSYNYEVWLTDARQAPTRLVHSGSLTTQTLFQWRKPAPDFSFLTGSCAYVNQPPYDRPGKPYGGDSSIFETMAREKAAFMLWLGDNWYTREVDYSSEWGLWYRALHDRRQPILQNFWRSMPHLAIWDDHDYGPNDYGKSYMFKQTSREVFRSMWLNPGYGEQGEGIYGRYTYHDVDFFMLDDRWWRDFDRLPDSVNGKPNPDKRMFGRQQMEWLKNELRYSKTNPFISFRIIATGSQVLNPGSPFDKLLDFPVEYYELMQFIRDEKIDGVLFLTGDRHHSEIIKVQHEGMYPLYDITCSPLTSGTHAFGGKEANNPWRVLGIDKLQNYGRISVTGARSNRTLKVEFLGLKGEKLGEWTVGEKELKNLR